VLLKLVLGSGVDGRFIEAGSVVKWHKNEGELVDYGDDLCDLAMQEYRAPKGLREVEKQRGELSSDPAKLAELAARLLEGDAPPMPKLDTGSFSALKGPEFVIRLTAIDRASLRRIHAPAGETRKAGDLLAVLTTDPAEPINRSAEASGRTILFRVVENVLWQVISDDDDLFSMKW
jgi:hypothetical protein